MVDIMQRRVLPFLLLIVFLTLPFITIMMMNHITLSDGLSRMSSGSYGNAYSIISFENLLSNQNVLAEASDGMNIAITSDYEHTSGMTIRSIFFNTKYANLPMQKGRFFKASDFTCENNVAVIGKNLVDCLFSRDGKNYITIDDFEYCVLGVLGYEKDTILDNYIFINALFQTEHTSNNLFLLDCFGADTEETIDTFITRLQKLGLAPQVLSSGKSILENLIPDILYGRFFIMILLCDILCIILLIQEWNASSKKDYCIFRLLGANEFDLIKVLLIQYGSIILITIPINVIACYILYPMFISYLILGYFSLILVLLFCFIGTVYKVINSSIPEVIK